MSDIRAWLKAHDLDRYADAFEENEITLDLARDLADADLKDLGMAVMGHRKTLLRAIGALSMPPTATSAMDTATTIQTSAPPLDTEGPREAERRQITVMFCDLVGSTALSERLDPEDLRDVMRAYQDATAGAIARFDGYIAQTLGDGLMVYFGFPVAHEDDAQRAMLAGLDILSAIERIKPTLSREHGFEIAVRIGMHTGIVVAGEVGASDTRGDMAVVGETPNVAARVEALARENTIVVSARTHGLVGGLFDFEDLGAHDLKGVEEPVQLFRVIAARAADQDDTAAVPPLIGRDEETGLLRRAWQSTKDEGRGQVVMISGEAGIGKSVLVERLKADVRAEGLPRLTMRCSPYHTGSASYPLIEHFKRLARWQPEDSDEVRLAKLEATLERYDQPLEETVPLLASLLSLPLPQDRYPPLALTPEKQKQLTQDAIVAITMETAERQPFLQLWEDLHWADPSTLELLGLLIEQAPTVSLLLGLTARPDFVPPWSGRSHITPITLNRLERPHAEALIARIAGMKSLPKEVVDHIVTKTDGVPLYVEELTKTILGSDILRDTGEGFELSGPLASLTIPDTLQESLMARLDRLPQVRELAQLGSVLGREFAYEMISGLSTTGETILQEGLGQLVDADLLYQRGRPPRARYTFKHALLQDAAYNSLLRRTRQQYHRQVAKLLEARFPDIVEVQPELLAHHYSIAGMADEAIAKWLEAGERAARASANAEAYANLKQGLEQLGALPQGADRDERELNLLIALIDPIIAIKGYTVPETNAVSERAIELCQQTGQTSRIFPALYGQWVYNNNRGNIVRAKELAADYLELANAQQDIVPRLVGHRINGTSFLHVGSPAVAMGHLDKAWTLFDSDRDAASSFSYGQDLGVTIEGFQAWASCLSGYPDRADKLAQEAVSRAQTVDHANTLAFALFFSAIVEFLLRDRRKCERLTAELEELADEQNLPNFGVAGMLLKGAILDWQGRPEEGLKKVEQGIEVTEKVQFNLYSPIWLLIRVELLRDLGRAEDALACISDGFKVISVSHEHWGDAELHRVRGEFHASLSDEAEAEAAYATALDIAREQRAKWWELRAAASLARLWQSQCKIAKAHDLLAPIYDWFTEGLDTTDLMEAKALLDQLK
jgi:class 3 adenylate cyclase/predicted ATPase